MASFNRFYKSVLLAVIFASTTLATPWPASAKHSTHRLRTIKPGFQLETFHPESAYETFGTGIDHPLSKRADAKWEDAAVAFIGLHLNVDASSISFKSGFEGESAKSAYVKQKHDGVTFANAVANVAFNNDNKVVSFGSSFVKPKRIPSSRPSVSIDDAIATAEKALGGKHNLHPPTIEYLAQQDGSAVLTHVIQIQNEDGAWFEAFVDAHSNEIRSVTDFVTKASYRVLPISKEIVDEGFETLVDPQNLNSSPAGWHSDGTKNLNTTTTAGNNAIAYVGTQSSVTKQSSPGLNFNYTFDPTVGPKVGSNIDAARTNAFYLVNAIHDITYQYGFTEAAFNFQNNNFGKGGKGNDRVTISVQSSAGTDNADFSTPPDGQSGAMRMFLWDLTKPQRDGALENDIVAHENTHGLTNRMTGGGTGRCLQTTEAGGMGEGWSDAFAEWTEQKDETVKDYVMGQYVVNKPAGIRTHPYSTSASVNPLRYSSIKTLNEVHDIGEIWANLLHNVYAALVTKNGFSTTAHTDASGTAGNVIFLHLFIDALALQPCNPTFLTARDAWIQADVNRYKGANKCTLWNAFASRGVGVNARNHNDDTTVPADCKASP